MVVDQEVNHPDERHPVVPLAAELFHYYAFFSNEIKQIWWLTRTSTIRKNDILSFYLQLHLFVTALYFGKEII